jgi:hypothetical protein
MDYIVVQDGLIETVMLPEQQSRETFQKWICDSLSLVPAFYFRAGVHSQLTGTESH